MSVPWRAAPLYVYETNPTDPVILDLRSVEAKDLFYARSGLFIPLRFIQNDDLPVSQQHALEQSEGSTRSPRT